jgi:hypothetical protein
VPGCHDLFVRFHLIEHEAHALDTLYDFGEFIARVIVVHPTLEVDHTIVDGDVDSAHARIPREEPGEKGLERIIRDPLLERDWPTRGGNCRLGFLLGLGRSRLGGGGLGCRYRQVRELGTDRGLRNHHDDRCDDRRFRATRLLERSHGQDLRALFRPGGMQAGTTSNAAVVGSNRANVVPGEPTEMVQSCEPPCRPTFLFLIGTRALRWLFRLCAADPRSAR